MAHIVKVCLGRIKIPCIAIGILMLPVFTVRIINPKPYSLTGTGLRKLPDWISSKRGIVNYVILTHLGIIHGKSVMMFGGDDHVSHASVFC